MVSLLTEVVTHHGQCRRSVSHSVCSVEDDKSIELVVVFPDVSCHLTPVVLPNHNMIEKEADLGVVLIGEGRLSPQGFDP